MSSGQNWSRAYARQALSDLQAREVLIAATPQVARCHPLHFLQMAAEKTCKAYLSAGSGNADVRRTHSVVKSVLPVIARELYRSNETSALPGWQRRRLASLAMEIEVLAPGATIGEVRKDNCEYPWADVRGVIVVPCEHKFAKIDEDERTFAVLIRLLRAAAKEYA